MGKHKNQGFSIHGFPWYCWQCCCLVCTGRRCPDRKHVYGLYEHHCADCVQSNGKLNRVLDCDFFQNKHTSRRYYRIKNRKHRQSTEEKLNLIMQKLGIAETSVVESYADRLVEEYNRKNGLE